MKAQIDASRDCLNKWKDIGGDMFNCKFVVKCDEINDWINTKLKETKKPYLK